MKKILLLSVILSSFLVGCNDDDPIALGPNTTIVGFPSASVTENFPTNVSAADLNVAVNLISYANEIYPANVTTSWNVDASSTAVEGVDYDMPAVTNSTIMSGSTVGYIPFVVHPNVFDAFAPKTIVINLTTVDSNNATIGAQYKQVEVTLQGVCVSELAGGYSTSTFRPATGVTYAHALENFTSIPGTSSYTTDFIGAYHGASQTPGSSTAAPGATTIVLAAAPSAGYEFTEVCGKLKLETQNLAGVYSNEVRQSATQYDNSFVDPVTGVVTIHYSIFFTGNTVERPFISTYTPL